MATNFPTNLDTNTELPVESSSTTLATNHVTNHTNVRDAVKAIETKVGADSSAVNTTHDFKLSGVSDGDYASSIGGTETLTNKTLTTPTITSPALTVGSDATGDIYYRGSGGFTRLAKGTDNQILRLASGLPSWDDETVNTDASTTAKGVVEAATTAEVTAGTATGSTGAVLAVTPDTLAASTPVFDGSGLTGIGAITYDAGICTSLDVTLTNSMDTNYDETITCGFQPRFIILKYFIRGVGSGISLGSMGTAIFEGTTLVSNEISPILKTNGRIAGSYPFYPFSVSSSNHTLNPDDTTTPLSAGGLSPSFYSTDWQCDLTISSVSSTGFVIRKRVRSQSSVSGSVTDVFHGSYEAHA